MSSEPTDDRLISYGGYYGPTIPTMWPTFRLPRGAGSVGASEQQCDDGDYLASAWFRTEGLYNNVEGEAIGDFC